MQGSKTVVPQSKPFLFLGGNPHRSKKMLQSYTGTLVKIDQHCSLMESSTTESSSEASSAIHTVTFRLGQKQQTFWYIRPHRLSLDKMVAKEKQQMKILESLSSSPAGFLEQKKVLGFQNKREQPNELQSIVSSTEEPISCCSLDFSIEKELTQLNSNLQMPADLQKLGKAKRLTSND